VIDRASPRLASCSRRTFIGGAAAVPIAASAALGIRTIPDEWDLLRVDYDLARSRHERFAALVHQACVARRPMEEIRKLEDSSDELYAHRIDALHSWRALCQLSARYGSPFVISMTI
jgi:hypothetical protein